MLKKIKNLSDLSKATQQVSGEEGKKGKLKSYPVETRIYLARTCYLMCRAQCKMKMLGSLVQKV